LDSLFTQESSEEINRGELTPSFLMNYGEQIFAFVTAFKDFEHTTVKSASGKQVTIVVRNNDRSNTQNSVETALKKNGLPQNIISRQIVGSSTFPATVVQMKNSKGIIIYKPQRGGGSGAGAAQTKLAECSQCLYASLAFNVKHAKIDATDISLPNFKESAKHIDVDELFESMANNLDDEWIKSSISGANALYDKYGGRGWIFHRGSSSVAKIENQFKKLNRTEKAFSNLNKWSPADIYMVKNMTAADWNRITGTKTIKSLNEVMVELINEEKLIGVSLKKIIGQAKPFKFYNLTKDRHVEDIGHHGTVISKTGNVFSSIDIYINWKGGKGNEIQFRTTTGKAQGWQGEIKGSNANQGKISFGPVNIVLEQFGLKELPNYTNSSRLSSEALAKEIYQDIKKIDSRFGMDEKTFVTGALAMDDKWQYSKYTGIKLGRTIADLDKPTQDKLVQALYLYANAQSPLSGPYGKIE
jgi:hypothetical protein